MIKKYFIFWFVCDLIWNFLELWQSKEWKVSINTLNNIKHFS